MPTASGCCWPPPSASRGWASTPPDASSASPSRCRPPGSPPTGGRCRYWCSPPCRTPWWRRSSRSATWSSDSLSCAGVCPGSSPQAPSCGARTTCTRGRGWPSGTSPWACCSPGTTSEDGGVMASHLRTSVFAIAVLVLAVPVLFWLQSLGLVLGDPWVLALLLPLVIFVSDGRSQQQLGSGRLDDRPLLRLVLAALLATVLCLSAGWS